MAREFDHGFWLLAALELCRGIVQDDAPINGVAENDLQGLKLDVVTPRGNRCPAFPLPSVDFSEANRLHGHPAKERRQPDECDAATVVGFRLEAGLDRRQPLVSEFLEANISILLALQPLGFRAEFHQSPLGDSEVVRFERAPGV